MREAPEQEAAEPAALPVIGHHDSDLMAGPGWSCAIPRDAGDALLIERDESVPIVMIDVDEPPHKSFVGQRDG